MQDATPEWLPDDATRADLADRLTAAASAMTTAALAEITRRYPWFSELDAANRASVTLVVRAGVDGFITWFREGATGVAQQNIFAGAPRELTRSLALQQTVDLIRATVETVEHQIVTELDAPDRPVLTTAVLHYSRETAFDAAEVYARAAEARGAWDARLEALVMDAVVRGDADDAVSSRASTLGWGDAAALCVVIGDPPPHDATVARLRTAATRLGLEVLAAIQGPRLVVLLGGTFDDDLDASAHVARLVDFFGAGPVVVGPLVDDLSEAVVSARAALSGRRAAPAWPEAPRPVLARSLLPERALAGDGHARRELAQGIFAPLAAYGGDLVTTLEAFWSCGTSIEATARRLFIHANTVRYRLGRIEELTGYSPSDPRDAYVLRLAGTLYRLLG
ncbi:PucR family transcriptional regulator [Propioniciclava soli]|uniref:Helix-turn-helix domain-containing protein n=1 Tax=Propioniciclava soli TaxID=2775081 RepID=A0ABZ3CB22_9ACTN|nr:helix-turn-helix domain-containing protein [Propioniciclava soli]